MNLAKSFASRSAAFCINGVWTGTLTGRNRLFAALPFANSMARSTAAFSPAMTICPAN